MLFPYVYVPHQMEKMQEFIDFIFYAVWCKARSKGQYRMELFASNAKLYDVMKAFHYDDSKGAEFFAGHVERIYALFAQLSAFQVKSLRRWYKTNNDVERVCANQSNRSPKRYCDFPEELKELRDQLASFFKDLYSYLGIAALKQWIGDIDDHYQTLWEAGGVEKCPFCGINDLLGGYHSKRDAYDHYLPKALYPFNSINFRNLVPACHHCNSSYKGRQDPAYKPKDPLRAACRRPAFYPYKAEAHSVELTVTVKRAQVDGLVPDDISISFGPDEISEQIGTWLDVYGIEERYKAKLCSNDAKDWLESFRIANRSCGYSASKYVEDIGKNDKFANCNFLKYSFLTACLGNGVLQAIENS